MNPNRKYRTDEDFEL